MIQNMNSMAMNCLTHRMFRYIPTQSQIEPLNTDTNLGRGHPVVFKVHK